MKDLFGKDVFDKVADNLLGNRPAAHMLIFKNKITGDYYAIAASEYDATKEEAKFFNLRDKYRYTIPCDDMEFIMDDTML